MSDILVNIENCIATITLNRPEKHNALTGEMMEQFVIILNELEQAQDVNVVVLTGAGERSFCSGADLGGMSENNEQSILDYKTHVTKYKNCLLSLHTFKKPTIAAVNGYALAGGLGLAASCDITFAIDQAQFGAPEINVGLWGMMISASLVETIGRKKTLELLYTGKKISADEALKIGLINNICTSEELMTNVHDFAKQLAQKNPTAIALGKEALHTVENLDFPKALNHLRDQVLILGETKDSKEGMKAFLEKRSPVWSGK